MGVRERILSGIIKPFLPSTGTLIGGAIGLVGSWYFLVPAGAGIITTTLIVGSATAVGAMIGDKIEYQWKLSRRLARLKLPEMTISRVRDGEGNTVFRLEDFKICDTEVIANGIENPDHDFSQEPSYSVAIKLKREDVTLGELDYGNWQEDNPDFDIVIYEKGSTEPVTDEVTKRRVLETLQIMPKFLGDNLYHPGDVATEVVAESSSVFADRLGSGIGGFLDRSYDRVRSLFTGEVVRISVKQDSAPSSKIETEEYLAELADVAIATGRYQELLGNYERVIRSTEDKALKLALERKKTEREVLLEMWGKYKVIAPIAFVAALVFFSLAVVAIIFPPVSVLFATYLVAALLGVSLITFAISLFTGYHAYFRDALLKRAIAKIEQEQNDRAQELENKFRGLNATRDNIQRLVSAHGDTLNLAESNLGNSCIVILARWVNSPQASSCQKINLAGNNLTDKEMAQFFYVLGNNHNVRELDVRGNTLAATSLEVLRDALKNNLALTSVVYDKTKITNELHVELQKQLLINRYLQRDLNEADREKMLKYFGSEAVFASAVFAKINSVSNIGALGGFQVRSDIPQLSSAIVQRQIKLVLLESRPRDFNLLVDYFNLYPQAEEHKLLDNINHGEILSLISASMFDDKGNFHFASNPGIQKLRSMDEPYRTDMLMHCFELRVDEHAHGLANIASQLIGFPGIFDRKQDTRALQSFRVFLSEIFNPKEGEEITFEEAIYLLKEIKQSATQEEAAKIDEVLRAVLPMDIAEQFGDCLQNYVGMVEDRQLAFRNYLDSNLDLLEFNFDDVTSLLEGGKRKNIVVSAEARKLIEDTILRNKLSQTLSGDVQDFHDFLEVFAGLAEENVQHIFASLVTLKNYKQAIVRLVFNDAKTNFSQLKKLPLLQRSLLLAMPLYTGQDTPIDREVVGFATLISGLVEISKESDGVLAKAIRERLFDRWGDLTFAQGYNNCSFIVHELAREYPELADKINLAYQTAVIEHLKTNYPFLIPGNNQAPSSEDLTRLEQAITGYLSDFTDYTYFLPLDILEPAKTVIKRSCLANRLKQVHEPADFVGIFKAVPLDMCEDVLHEVGENRIWRSVVVRDLGEARRLSCDNLRRLDHEHLVALFKACFSISENPGKAHKKAILISGLLSAVFDGVILDELAQTIKMQVFYAISPEAPSAGFFRNLTTGVKSLFVSGEERPHYRFDAFVGELNKIIEQTLENDQNSAGINKIRELLAAVRVETIAEEVPVVLQEERLDSRHD